MLNLGDRNFIHRRPESPDHIDSSFNRSANLLIKTFSKIFAENTYPHTPQIIGERTLIAWDGLLRARGVFRVLPSNRFEQDCGILDRPGDWRNMVQAPTQRYHSESTHPAISWLEPNRSAKT